MIVRYIFGVVLGAVATFALFMLMQMLIKSDKSPFDDSVTGKIVDFVRLQEENEIETKNRKPKPPPPPDEPPPDMPQQSFDNSDVSIGVDMGMVDTKVDLNVGGIGGFSSDGEYLPIVKVAPIYPSRALQRRLEGYVVVEFVVTSSGAVRDVRVVESTAEIFEAAAIEAAQKFKYRPRIIDGQPIEVPGVRNRISFTFQA
jgi:protein TonB